MYYRTCNLHYTMPTQTQTHIANIDTWAYHILPPNIRRYRAWQIAWPLCGGGGVSGAKRKYFRITFSSAPIVEQWRDRIVKSSFGRARARDAFLVAGRPAPSLRGRDSVRRDACCLCFCTPPSSGMYVNKYIYLCIYVGWVSTRPKATDGRTRA